jgi:AcrR family transcriptional regulator
MSPSDRKAGKVGSASNNRLELIIDAAASMFDQKGYSATSTQDIATEVGLLKGSIYYYIDSKEDILFRIIEDSHAGALKAISTVSHLDVDPLARAYSLVKTHVRVFHDDRVKHSVFFKEFRSLSDERKEIIRGTGHDYSLFLKSILEEGQIAGLVDESLDARMATSGIIGMLNAMATWYQDGGPWGPEMLGTQFAEQAIMGVVSEEHLAASGGRTALIKSICENLEQR